MLAKHAQLETYAKSARGVYRTMLQSKISKLHNIFLPCLVFFRESDLF